MHKVKWGIIGCGDVAERKSGPAFQKIDNSELIAVMRRNATKAANYATRHSVPKWYDNVDALLENPDINAVYIATPPSSHFDLAVKALLSGKDIYLEKPMVLNISEAKELCNLVNISTSKLTVAHYRRQLSAFLKVKSLLENHSIGEIRYANIEILQPANTDIVAQTEENWRLNPAISGGGYFYDLAPHQLDLMCQYFGSYQKAIGTATNQSQQYAANDLVTGMIHFENNVIFNGIWCFNVNKKNQKDQCKIYGSKGTITFSFYGDKVHLESDDLTTVFTFNNPEYIQYPMIEATVAYFLGKGGNPCSVEEGLRVMNIMKEFTA